MAIKSISIEKLGKRTQVELTESDGLAQALLQNVEIGIYIVQDGRFQYVNPAFQELTGYAEKDLIGKYSLRFIHPEDRETIRKKAIENLKGCSPLPYEYRFIGKDREVKWVLEKVAFIEYGGKLATLGSFIDITARKQAEEALKESENRYRAIFNSPLQIVYINDLQGRFLEANDCTLKMMWYPQEEVRKLTYQEIVYPEDLPRAFEYLAQVAASGIMPPVEIRVVAKSGELVWIETSAIPLEQDGEVYAVMGFAQDITERKRAEEVLRESEERYRGLFENSIEGVFTADITNHFTSVNKALEEITGYSQEEFSGMNYREFVSPEVAEVLFQQYTRLFKTGEPIRNLVYDLVRKNGERRWVEGYVNLIKKENEVAGFQGTIRDITERKRTEEKLAKAAAIIDAMVDGITITDMQGRMVNINRAATVQTGYEEKDVIGKTPTELFIVGKDQPKFYENLEAMLSGKPIEDTEYLLRRKDGTELPVSINLSVLRDSEGNPDKIVAVHRDITESKRAEEALGESEERFRGLFENSIEGVFTADLATHFTSVNMAMEEISGCSQEELIGMSYRKLTSPEATEFIFEQYNKLFRTGVPLRNLAYELIRKNGERRLLEGFVNVIRKGNKIVGFQGTIRDITEHKRAEEEREALYKDLKETARKLEHSNKELQDFAYIASHDLREPLRKISSFGTLLQDSLEGKLDEDQQENFEFMIEGAKRMQTMIDDLLTYSRLTTRAKPPERVDLNEVMKDLRSLELATRLDETKGIIHVPEPLPSIQGDPSQMHQLLQNLIGNGLKFHQEGIPPEITVRAHEIENDMVRMEVQDNGIGIDEKYYEQIFTMFKRLNSRAHYEGTGIGLAVCKKIVNRHGGEIGVESTPGEGTTFWFMLPRESYAGRKLIEEE